MATRDTKTTAAPATHDGPAQDRHAPAGLELGYARVSATKQDLTRQLEALAAAGIPDERIFVDKRRREHRTRRLETAAGLRPARTQHA